MLTIINSLSDGVGQGLGIRSMAAGFVQSPTLTPPNDYNFEQDCVGSGASSGRSSGVESVTGRGWKRMLGVGLGTLGNCESALRVSRAALRDIGAGKARDPRHHYQLSQRLVQLGGILSEELERDSHKLADVHITGQT